jgi:Uma2 family endonuclease
MIAILESPDVRQRALPITVETYHRLVANGMVAKGAELIRGVIVEKISKGSLHVFVVNRIWKHLSRALGEGWLVRKGDPLTLSDSEPEPDVSVVKGAENDFTKAHPRTAALAVEIAVSSESSDREMILAYAEAGVEECWLVLALRREIEFYSKPEGGQYREVRRLGAGETLVSAALPGVSVEIGTLFPG